MFVSQAKDNYKKKILNWFHPLWTKIYTCFWVDCTNIRLSTSIRALASTVYHKHVYIRHTMNMNIFHRCWYMQWYTCAIIMLLVHSIKWRFCLRHSFINIMCSPVLSSFSVCMKSLILLVNQRLMNRKTSKRFFHERSRVTFVWLSICTLTQCYFAYGNIIMAGEGQQRHNFARLFMQLQRML